MALSSAQSKEIHLYEQEIKDTLKRLDESMPSFLPIGYFVKAVNSYFNFQNIRGKAPAVIVFGTGIPEEIIYAAGTTPYWILGGSLGSTAWADDLVPRDTDAVSRSIFGFLVNEICEFSKDALIIIPAANDSSRKLAYLLKRAGNKVHTVDIPPVKDSFAAEKWNRQLERCAEVLAAHTRRPITRRTLNHAAKMVASAKQQMQKFIALSHSRSELISSAFRMFILGSYYYAENIEEWTTHLVQLNGEISKMPPSQGDKGNVLLLGSPVYFPNFKIPFLIEDVGLNISLNVDYTTQKVLLTSSRQMAGSLNFDNLGRSFLRKDSSSAYTKNDTLYESVCGLIGKRPFDGVVYHVLKGQIEYDFELDRFEELFGHHNIPVFRLETDYKYQDVEQLRIRMEAFAEMLHHRRRYGKAGYAV